VLRFFWFDLVLLIWLFVYVAALCCFACSLVVWFTSFVVCVWDLVSFCFVLWFIGLRVFVYCGGFCEFGAFGFWACVFEVL